MYKTYKCYYDARTKYVRAIDEGHAALIMSHWLQVECGTDPKEWTRVLVAGIGYDVQAPSGFVKKV